MDVILSELLIEILLSSSYEDIMNFLQTNTKFSSIKDDEFFWERLLIRDFSFQNADENGETYLNPLIANVLGLSDKMSFRETYQALDSWIRRMIDDLDTDIVNNLKAYQITKKIVLYAAEKRTVDPAELFRMSAQFNYLEDDDIHYLCDEITSVTEEIEEALKSLNTIRIWNDSMEALESLNTILIWNDSMDNN